MPGSEQFCCAYSASRNYVWRYVWIDAFWYLPDQGDRVDCAAFASASATTARTGSGRDLMLGTASLDQAMPT